MSWLLICSFVIGLICLIQGLRKSTVGKATRPQQHCAQCGWTNERVQLCEFEQHNMTKVVPMCFNCAVKHEAIPVRTPRVETSYIEAYA
jgi:hypothetical protein